MRADREHVTFQRPVMVELVPYGTPIEIGAGMTGHITQALGGNFTLVVDGQMVRLKGSDADAIGKDAADAQQHPEPEEDDGADLHTRIYRALATCYDPEIPVNIVELGLIYACEIEPLDDGRSLVRIQMTLTAPGCGMGEVLANEVADKVLVLRGVGEVKVDLVFDPPWDRYRMSEAAQLALGL
ncbi:MAG: putative Fe-S cluster assembly protein SufT [Rubrivivax sp.]|nr:putative Fe-S cluster assembly protein SufT [Pseudomonadota bacterium]MCW5638120.1 putative Fe-S cluster assembly protein SufT [Rubrivivax sp.]